MDPDSVIVKLDPCAKTFGNHCFRQFHVCLLRSRSYCVLHLSQVCPGLQGKSASFCRECVWTDYKEHPILCS